LEVDDPVSHSNLILIMGDQLSPKLSALGGADKARDTIFMCEVAAEATYVKHHKKKMALIFAAMRAFADGLRAQGWQVDYVTLDDPDNGGSFDTEVARAVARRRPAALITTKASEYRVLQMQRAWCESLACTVHLLEDDRFICSTARFNAWADDGRKQLRMEFFYRDMRRFTGLLMDGDQPVGGQWNFDHDNRKPAKAGLSFPEVKRFPPSASTQAVLGLVASRFPDHFGDLEPFWFGVTAHDAQASLDHFIDYALPQFGDYQDAMLKDQRFLYHSLISFYLNLGLLDPLDTCRAVEAAWRAGHCPLAAAEGFIRQILGWREYVRGLYWREMPDYATANALNAQRHLPDFYWTGDTDMTCLKSAITQTKEEAYAHHIQRLMVTGNFALLAGIKPDEVHEWYLAVYADAFEWVEMPNTIGMSQFADGGLLASKPYASSGAYIDRMSDYCAGCHYNVKEKSGSKACPFNYLYWDFLVRHREKLANNPRMAVMYRTFDKMEPSKQKAVLESARVFLGALGSVYPAF
jgi:deoxyribodipyrimidine photolyase-related protein